MQGYRHLHEKELILRIALVSVVVIDIFVSCFIVKIGAE